MAESVRVALVTGGGQGIGRSICLRLAQDGLAVAVVDANFSWAEECVRLMADLGCCAAAFQADVTKQASASQAVADVGQRFGRLDVLVNNAGGNGRPPAPFEAISEADWDAVVGLNLTAHWRMARLALPLLAGGDSPRIISVTSASAFRGLPTGLAAYIAAKAGVIGLVRALAHELGPRAVTVNGVAPGFIITETPKESIFGEEGRRAAQQDWVEDQAIPRAARAEDVAAAVSYLASPAAGFVTGHILSVDGGWGLPG